MKNIKEFIINFIEKEYQCEYAKWDIDVSNEEYEVFKDQAYSFMHSRSSNPFGRARVLEGLLKDSKKRALAIIKLKKITPRTLFQIKHYQNPILGDALKRIVTGDYLYGCYVSYPSRGGRELYFSSIFYVAETNEGLKIIYEKSFNSDTGIWYHPVDISVGTVMDEGKLIAVEKYQAPVEATSLADYNKE
ncbi:hypothetical protein [Fluviicola taffensis]|uniref:hypothetical protein n=1 Tax=Fluviicola taffensis TaxID=191579 RepID=UPI003137AA00